MRIVVLFLTLIVFQAKAQDTLNCTDSLGRKQGHWIFYKSEIPDSGKVEEGNYVNDKKEGTWIKYHDDGITPKLKGEYQNNRPSGRYVKTGPYSDIREIGYFTKSVNQDSLKRYHENGQLEYESWRDENGKEQGRVNFFYPNGQLEYTYLAVDGIPKNTEHYDKNGNLIGKLDVCTYPVPVSKSDTPATPEEIAKHQLPETPDSPDTHGIKFLPDSYNKLFNGDQEIWQDGVFKNGKLYDGKVYVYDRDGILLEVQIFKDGVYCCDGQL